ncbi:hypothetical protein LXL04_030845 [Taraxacum kok-saghyz]
MAYTPQPLRIQQPAEEQIDGPCTTRAFISANPLSPIASRLRPLSSTNKASTTAAFFRRRSLRRCLSPPTKPPPSLPCFRYFDTSDFAHDLVEEGKLDKAIAVYEHVKKKGFCPNAYTYGIVVKDDAKRE